MVCMFMQSTSSFPLISLSLPQCLQPIQNGTSSVGDCHQSGIDWGCGGSRLPPQTSVLSHCSLPHQEQPQHGGKTRAKHRWSLDCGLSRLIYECLLFLLSGLVHPGICTGVLARKVYEEGLFWTAKGCRNGGRFCLWLWLIITYSSIFHALTVL